VRGGEEANAVGGSHPSSIQGQGVGVQMIQGQVMRAPVPVLVETVSLHGSHSRGTSISEASYVFADTAGRHPPTPPVGPFSFGPRPSTPPSDKSVGKKCKLIMIPLEMHVLAQMCLRTIGQGQTFCTNFGCLVNHQGPRLEVAPGELFLIKSGGQAFVDPRFQSAVLDEALRNAWLLDAMPIEDWLKRFLLAAAADDGLPVSGREIEEEERFAKKAALFKTPNKRQRTSREVYVGSLHVSPYLRRHVDEEARDIPLTEEELMDMAVTTQRLDKSLEEVTMVVINLVAEYKRTFGELAEGARAFDYTLKDLISSLGRRPGSLSEDYNSPMAWGSIAALASKVDTFKLPEDPLPALVAMAKAERTQLSQDLATYLSTKMMDMENKYSQLKMFVGEELTKVMTERNPAPAQNDISSDEIRNSMSLMDARVDGLKEMVMQLQAKKDEQAIQFHNLGFRGPEEAASWMEKELPDAPFGLIVDVHIVMEHVHASMTNQTITGRLQQLCKINITSLADGLAITSFESRIPKFFSDETKHRVLTSNDSFFNLLPDFNGWDFPKTGYRDRLKEELYNFKASQEFRISEQHAGTAAYSVAMHSVTSSLSWIEGFIVFIDDYYKELTKAMFGKAKAWSVTTRLARRMLMDVAAPRIGVQNHFRTGHNSQIAAQIFWAVLKCHDIMQVYQLANYQDHPSVSAELVKFLAVNTGYEQAEQMCGDIGRLSQEREEDKRSVAAAQKAVSTTANKVDELKKVVDALAKRVAACEKK
jgi:hypothetical protein